MKPVSMHRRLALSVLAFMLTFALSDAQQSRMNTFGHFPDAKTRLTALTRATEPGLDTLHLIGNSVFRTVNGFITIDGLYENAPAQLRVYSPNGELRYQKESRQMVNTKLSPNKRYVAWHDMERIHIFNTVCLNSKTVEGSNVFAVDNGYNVAYYNEADGKRALMEQVWRLPNRFTKSDP
ncbi:MAG: hypothetical protein U0176_10390 [Bacteroidia bacterium]